MEKSYSEYLKKEYPSDTAKGYLYDVRGFERFLRQRYDDENSVLENAAAADVIAYMNWLSASNNSEAMINRMLSSLRNYYDYLQDLGVINNSPVKNVKSLKVSTENKQPLLIDECRKLLESIDGRNSLRDQLIILMNINCCLTASELASIRTADITDECLIIRDNDKNERMIPLDDALKSILRRFLSDERIRTRKFLFSGNDEPMPLRTIQLIVTNRLKKSGIYRKGMSTVTLKLTGAYILKKYCSVGNETLSTVYGINKPENIIVSRDEFPVGENINKNPLVKLAGQE
ncbi:MAG: site-specific integrase [Eubacteriaceae bacterium]|nr:site-specific integrase [Eubacteriaceae bacterium]